MKPQFLSQGQERGHDTEILEKIWKDWEAFASYAFNKSHSTCYAFVAFQTAYLKAHHPAEFMAAVLCLELVGDGVLAGSVVLVWGILHQNVVVVPMVGAM